MKMFLAFVIGALFSPGLSAQQRTTHAPRLPSLPANMDCEKLKGDAEVPPNRSTTILKRGTDFYICHPKTDAVLATAKTAAIAVRSTQTISCGDGSSDDCIREDTATERQIEALANKTELWRYFDKVAPSKADLILRFAANNRASSSAQIILQVQESDSGAWAYYESRTITDIENDVNRLIDHFLVKSGRVPLRSREETDRDRQCAAVVDQLSALKSQYQKRRNDYDFKNSHPLDAQMEECKLHWQDWVCLKRGGE